MTTYDSLLKTWLNTAIVIPDNPVLRGRKFGDDSGYRKMKTLGSNDAAFATPDIMVRANYEGICPYTGDFTGRKLGGGLRDGVFILREAAARSVTLADETLRHVSGNSMMLLGLDAYRSGLRQQLGYTEKLMEQMAMIGLTVDDVNADRRIAEFIGCSIKADGVFSWVKVAQDTLYEALETELKSIPSILEGCQEYADNFLTGNVDDALYEYIIACRNAGIGRAADRGTLVSENNAHAGGGACDLMIMYGGKLRAITPFDFPGCMSAYDFLEIETHFDSYQIELATNQVLQNHLRNCGYDPVNFSWENWEELRGIKRVQYHLGRASGWTFYSMGTYGGEHWHEEPGNRVKDPVTGEIVWAEAETELLYPDRGNPGHSLQLFGEKDTAIWGGESALKIVTKSYGFEE